MSVKALYRTSATATGGRDGSARSDDWPESPSAIERRICVRSFTIES